MSKRYERSRLLKSRASEIRRIGESVVTRITERNPDGSKEYITPTQTRSNSTLRH